MEFQELFFDRRSIRKFSDKPIDKHIIKIILEAAMYAPSAVNRQPWHFIALDDREQMNRVMDFHPHARMLATAAMAIVVCGDLDRQHGDGYWVVDCGAATQNLLLAAHYQGLGGCWVGLHPREDRKKPMTRLLALPDRIEPFAMVALGYPAEKKARPARFDPDRIRRNTWNTPYFHVNP